MRTLQVIYLEGKQRLQKAGNESPAFDAICLFEHVFHMNRQDLMLHGNTKQATLEQETEFFSLIEQRAKKRPLQYILGEWPFLDFHLKMGEGVLIAREDTTVLVETATKLIQTKQAAILDKVKGLKLGAEDYIVKPFETVELLARIEVVLRRKHKSNNTIHYGDITMNIDEHTVKKGDDYVSLTPKEFDILAFFLQNQDIALTRERLLATVWGYEFMGETRTVDIHVQQIRKKMGLHNKLVTIPKLGYRLERNN